MSYADLFYIDRPPYRSSDCLFVVKSPRGIQSPCCPGNEGPLPLGQVAYGLALVDFFASSF
jgi:hypothetical protein